MFNLYDNIANICARKGISPSAMCLKAGLSKSTISRLRGEEDAQLSFSSAKKMADVLGVTVDEILHGQRADDDTDRETAELLQELKDNPATRMLMHAAKDADPAQVMAVAEMLMKFKGDQ